ncbi:MAG: hypothetical protein H0S79_20820 [Anaerolineaceae bacterium]|nr:hypothetical protein [Anaerolineaceae bacterium]
MSSHNVDQYGHIIIGQTEPPHNNRNNNQNGGRTKIIIIIVFALLGCMISICALATWTTNNSFSFELLNSITSDNSNTASNNTVITRRVDGTGVYRNNSQYYVEVYKIEYSFQNNSLRVYFESFGQNDLWRPESSCVVLYPGNQRFDPTDYDLTIEKSNHYAGSIVYRIPVEVGYRYNFIYHCRDEYEDVVLFHGSDLIN